jgi:hypothetical protein
MLFIFGSTGYNKKTDERHIPKPRSQTFKAGFIFLLFLKSSLTKAYIGVMIKQKNPAEKRILNERNTMYNWVNIAMVNPPISNSLPIDSIFSNTLLKD